MVPAIQIVMKRRPNRRRTRINVAPKMGRLANPRQERASGLDYYVTTDQGPKSSRAGRSTAPIKKRNCVFNGRKRRTHAVTMPMIDKTIAISRQVDFGGWSKP